MAAGPASSPAPTAMASRLTECANYVREEEREICRVTKRDQGGEGKKVKIGGSLALVKFRKAILFRRSFFSSILYNNYCTSCRQCTLIKMTVRTSIARSKIRLSVTFAFVGNDQCFSLGVEGSGGLMRRVALYCYLHHTYTRPRSLW